MKGSRVSVASTVEFTAGFWGIRVWVVLGFRALGAVDPEPETPQPEGTPYVPSIGA